MKNPETVEIPKEAVLKIKKLDEEINTILSHCKTPTNTKKILIEAWQNKDGEELFAAYIFGKTMTGYSGFLKFLSFVNWNIDDVDLYVGGSLMTTADRDAYVKHLKEQYVRNKES